MCSSKFFKNEESIVSKSILEHIIHMIANGSYGMKSLYFHLLNVLMSSHKDILSLFITKLLSHFL